MLTVLSLVAVTGDALSSSSFLSSNAGLVTIGKPLELLDPTHRGLHRFVPRHPDEIEIDIGDPVYVQREAEDLWREGKVKHNFYCSGITISFSSMYSNVYCVFISKDQFKLE